MGESQAVAGQGQAQEQLLERELGVIGATEPLDPVVATPPKAPSRRDSQRRRLLALGDVVAIIVAYGLVLLVDPPPVPVQSRLFLLGQLPLWILLNKLLGLYDRDANVMHKSTLDELPRIVHSVVLGSAAAFLLLPAIPGITLFREQTLLVIAALLLTMPAVRAAVRHTLNQRVEPERVLIVGSGSVAQLLASKLAKHPEYKINLVGFIDEAWANGLSPADAPPLVGHVEDFEYLCNELDIERVVIAFSSLSHEDLLGVVRAAKQLNLKVTVVPRLFEGIGDAVEIEQVEGLTLLGLRGLSRTQSSLRLKRTLDVIAAGGALMLLTPVLIGVTLAIKLTSGGPVLFRQQRIGRGNHPFTMLKFRTMYDGADERKAELLHLNELNGPMFKMDDDPRITRVGRVLRRYSLDELPQLWNVVRGEMSLVGPRPLVPHEAEHVIGRHRARIDLVPGVTGPWQVMGRTAIPFAEMVKLDYLYVAEWSLWNDVKLLLRTAAVVVEGTGK